MSECVSDPSKRYLRRDLVKENGRLVTYNAVDKDEGTEVSWYELSTQGANDSRFRELCQMIQELGSITHKNIISLHHAWVDTTRHKFVYITELGTDTLRSYVTTVVKNPSRAIISNWCYQIISALDELHNHNIIHGNLTCDTIFFDSAEGVVKVGIPGFERVLFDTEFVLADPEGARSDPRSDVWLLGLIVVELCTGEQPYSECESDGEKRVRIMKHEMPLAFNEVPDPIVADLVVTCLLPLGQRPTAAQLCESQLFAELNIGDSSPRRSQDEIKIDTKTTDVIGDVKTKPEFLELLKRQTEEKEALLRQQREARRNLKAKIRERQQNKKSLRELLSIDT